MGNCFKTNNTNKPKFREILLNEYPQSLSEGTKNKERKRRLGTRNNEQDYMQYPPNVTKSSKYSLISFLPVALFQYFSKATNFYFLFMTILQLIPAISPFNAASVLSPLLTVTILSLIREGWEDYVRHKSDK